MKSTAGSFFKIPEVTVFPSGITDPLFYRRSMFSKIFVSGVKMCLRGFLKFCFRLEIFGSPKMLAPGPFLICPNHLSDIDPLLLYSFLPEDTCYIAYERNFRHPPLSWIVRYARVLLTTRGGKIPHCLIRASHALQSGFSICMFPEGGRTTSGALMEPREGMAILAKQARIPIIPVRIEGSENLLSHLRPGFRFSKIRITFGDPIDPDSQDHAEVLQNWRRAVLQLQQGVTS